MTTAGVRHYLLAGCDNDNNAAHADLNFTALTGCVNVTSALTVTKLQSVVVSWQPILNTDAYRV